MGDPSSSARADSSGDFVPATDELRYERQGAVAWLTFNRPAARNAMTWAMYQGLYDACAHVEADDRIRVFVLRGAGDKAFVAGTDISQFQAFSTAEDALGYERNMERYIGRLEALAKPTIAMIRGYCVGGGAGIALACDLRVATPDARFGVPIARTIGNTLALGNVGRMVDLLGPARTKEVLFTARFVEAAEGQAIGLFNAVVEPERLETSVAALAERIAGHAPLTIRSTKEAVRRLLERRRLDEADDLILACYLSEDFREGIAAFLAKRRPEWKGR